MQGTKILYPVHIPGTLSADVVYRFQLPCALQLLELSACASNDSDATLKVGNASDDDAYLQAATIGDSGTPKIFSRANFVGGQFPHLADNTVLLVTVDFDGSSGTAAQNLQVLMTFSEG